jgi:co-chaperonin GroES (HSP10)
LSDKPDFDQILSVKIDNPPSEEELSRGVSVVIPDRANSASRRIKEKVKVVGQGHVTEAHQFLQLQIQADVELYFEEGELSSSRMTNEMFDPTMEESKAGFGD